MVEGGEDVGASLGADGDAAKAGEPGKRTLDHPSVPSQALAVLDTALAMRRTIPRRHSACRQWAKS